MLELQTRLQEVTMPWKTEMDQLLKTWENVGGSLHFDTLKTYSELLKLASIPYSPVFIPFMDEDEVDDETNTLVSVNDNTESVELLADYSTRAADVNRINQEDLEYFRSRSEEIVNAIASTDFEDGMENDVTELIGKYVRRNKFAAYIWLNDLFSSNLLNTSFVEGLLRTIAMVTEKGDETTLLPIVLAGLRSQVSSEQEAAIMVIEEWRTKECLDAMKTTDFGNGWLKVYADKVMQELEKEQT